jgi:hypothetical protein
MAREGDPVQPSAVSERTPTDLFQSRIAGKFDQSQRCAPGERIIFYSFCPGWRDDPIQRFDTAEFSPTDLPS